MTAFPNLAGVSRDHVESIVRQELNNAGISDLQLECNNSVSNYKIIGKIDFWVFYRKDYYYFAKTNGWEMKIDKARAFSNNLAKRKLALGINRNEIFCKVNIGREHYVSFEYSLFTERSLQEFVKFLQSYH